MRPIEFRRRFVAGVLPDPPGLELGFDEFVQVGESEVEGVALKSEDRELLTTVGLPRAAPPFFNFDRYPDVEAEGLPEGTFRLGANGSGDPICLEISTGAIVVFNHDRAMERILLNSSLTHLAQCLCIYQEHLHAREMASCMSAVFAVDPALRGQDGYWEREVRHDLLRT